MQLPFYIYHKPIRKIQSHSLCLLLDEFSTAGQIDKI